jgi:hypothetical protein
MKYLNTFLEKLGYAEPIDKYVDFLLEYIIKDYDKWFFRKGLANSSKIIKLNFADEGLTISKDFPLRNMDLKLTYSTKKWFRLTTSGFAWSNYKRKFELGITIITPKGTTSVDIEKIRTLLTEILSHEITHLYQNHKKKAPSHFILKSEALYRALLNFIKNIECPNSYVFLVCIYYLTKSETAAEMASLYKTGNTRILPYEITEKGKKRLGPYFLKYLAEGDVQGIVDKLITNEFDEEYYHKWVNDFIKEYEEENSYFNEQPIAGLINLKDKGIKEFVEFFVSKYQKRAKQVLYKIDKFKYLRNENI